MTWSSRPILYTYDMWGVGGTGRAQLLILVQLVC